MSGGGALIDIGVHLLDLALAYHLGANNASAQSSAGKVRLIAAAGDNVWVVTETDDVYLISGKGKFDFDIITGRVDYRISDRQNVFTRFNAILEE